MADIRKRSGAKGTTYQVRYADPSAKTGYAFKTFKTLKEARGFREGPKPETRSHDITIAEAVEEWLTVCQQEGRDGRPPVSTATYRYYEYVAGIIKSYAWPTTLRQLTKPEVVTFRSWLIENHGRTLAAKVLTCFHGVLAEMGTRNRVNGNVAAEVRIRQSSRYDEPHAIPTAQEVADLLAAADALANSRNEQTARTWARYRPMLYLAVDSGMRPQEHVAVALRNFADGGVHVERAIDRGGQLSVPKTPAARRFIPLTPETFDMVTHFGKKKATRNAHDLIFPTETGNWQSLDNWRKRCFVAACEKAGLVTEEEGEDGTTILVPRYTPYSLRHYYASVLIADGVDIPRIATLMGHTDFSTTLDNYAHLIKRAEDTRRRQPGLIDRLRSHNACGNSVASTT